MSAAATAIRPAARPCLLQGALGRTERCPGRGCPFWEEGGAVVEPGCLAERMLGPGEWPPELAHRWLRLRAVVVAGGDLEVHRLFYLLPRD